MPIPGAPRHFVAESSANADPFLHFAIRAILFPCCRGADTVREDPGRSPLPLFTLR